MYHLNHADRSLARDIILALQYDTRPRTFSPGLSWPWRRASTTWGFFFFQSRVMDGQRTSVGRSRRPRAVLKHSFIPSAYVLRRRAVVVTLQGCRLCIPGWCAAGRGTGECNRGGKPTMDELFRGSNRLAWFFETGWTVCDRGISKFGTYIHGAWDGKITIVLPRCPRKH